MTLNLLSPVPAPPPGALAEGSRVGEYTLGACIGEGGMARVYSAEHAGLRRPVALKVLIDGQNSEPRAHERFLREACIAAAIRHPNVVNIFDVGVHEGRPYLVMDLLEGVDLEAFVQAKGRLDEATIVDILVPIAAGLAAVHDAGIVHRDLKPSNIFLARGRDGEVEPRLLDFGISKMLGADELKLTAARGLLLGTPFYMAPEGVRGGEMTPLSDQYALGVVLYECATGVNPFIEASSFSDVVRRVGLGELPSVASKNPGLSPRLVAVIERAMQLEPARRFPDVRALGRELLLLASQRTRVAWNLSFTVLSARSAQARVAASSSPSVSGLRRPKRSRAVRRLPWAVLAVAALSFSWARDREAQLTENSGAPHVGTVPPVQATALPAEAASQARDPGPATPPVERVLLLAPRPGVANHVTSSGAEAPATPSPSAARPRAAPARSEQTPASPAGSKPRRAIQFGTNRAPIFD